MDTGADNLKCNADHLLSGARVGKSNFAAAISGIWQKCSDIKGFTTTIEFASGPTTISVGADPAAGDTAGLLVMMDVPMGPKGFREFYQSHTGYICDKWEQYVGAYDTELRAILARGQAVRMLEIGVQNGGSLQLWAQALPPGSEVVGIDIDPGCADLALPANARVLIGNAADEAFLQSVLGTQTFDLIVDDGSHRSHDVVRSFGLLFPRLRPGGRYFIEDLHASYWREFGGGFRAPDSAVEFLKSLIDALHADHLRPDAAIDPMERATLAALNQAVARVTFIDSLVVLEKYAAPKSRPFVRVLAGTKSEDARPEWRDFVTNWSGPLLIFEDAARAGLDAALQGKVSDLRGQVATARSAAAAAQAQLAAAELALRDGEAARRALDDTLNARTATLADAKRQLDEQTQAHQALRHSHDSLRQSHDTLQQAYDALRQAHAALTQSHEALRLSHDDARRRLKAIKRSWSWRLSWPARRLERIIRRVLER